MNILPGFILALTAILAISYLRSFLIRELQSISLLTIGSTKIGLIVYAIILLPGTIIHELSHWLTAELLRVPTGEIKLLPSLNVKDEGEHNLGSVKTAKSDPFRGFLIGTAPLITGIATLIFLARVFRDLPKTNLDWKILLVGYLIFIISNSMMTSRQDRRYWPVIFLLSLLLYLAAYISDISPPTPVLQSIFSLLDIINPALILSALVNILILSILYISRKLIEVATGHKIALK